MTSCFIPPPPPPSSRLFKHATNVTWTTKYNSVTFLPKALFEQYRRLANILFTVNAGLTFTPVSPTTPISSMVPLGFVLGASLVKEGIEDANRRRSDKLQNAQLVDVYEPHDAAFVPKEWREVQVGRGARGGGRAG